MLSYLQTILHPARWYVPDRRSSWTSHDQSLPAQPVPLSEEPLCRRTACADRGVSAAAACTLVFSRPVCSPCGHEKARMRPLFGRRAPHGSCLAGEPGTTCCRRLYRRQRPPERRRRRVISPPNTYVPQEYVQFVLKDLLNYQELSKIRVFLKAFVLAIRFESSPQHRKQAPGGFFLVLVVEF